VSGATVSQTPAPTTAYGTPTTATSATVRASNTPATYSLTPNRVRPDHREFPARAVGEQRAVPQHHPDERDECLGREEQVDDRRHEPGGAPAARREEAADGDEQSDRQHAVARSSDHRREFASEHGRDAGEGPLIGPTPP